MELTNRYQIKFNFKVKINEIPKIKIENYKCVLFMLNVKKIN